MEYCIYCDESCHLEHDGVTSMALGCVWCEKTHKDELYKQLREIKVHHGIAPHCELKWNGVSPSKKEYYKDVINFFFQNDKLHYRILVVPNKSELQHDTFNQTHDEFYYKMYFDLLKTIIDPDDIYEVYLDMKDTRGQKKIEKLRNVLCNSHYDFDQKIITKIQQLKSSDSELVELADFFTGAICYFHRVSQGENLTSSTKSELIDLIKELSGYSLLRSTLYKEDKMNIFIWRGIR